MILFIIVLAPKHAMGILTVYQNGVLVIYIQVLELFTGPGFDRELGFGQKLSFNWKLGLVKNRVLVMGKTETCQRMSD